MRKSRKFRLYETGCTWLRTEDARYGRAGVVEGSDVFEDRRLVEWLGDEHGCGMETAFTV